MTESRADIAAESLVASKQLDVLIKSLRTAVARSVMGTASHREIENLVDQCAQQLQIISGNARPLEEAKP